MISIHELWLHLLDYLPDVTNAILGFLGVWLCFPSTVDKLDEDPRKRRLIAGTCLALSLLGCIAGVYLKTLSDTEMRNLEGNAREAKENTTQLLITFGTAMPQIAQVETNVTAMRLQLAQGGRNPDPKAIAELRARMDAAQKQTDGISKSIALAMAPGILTEMVALSMKFDSDDRVIDGPWNAAKADLDPKVVERARAELEKKRATLNAEYAARLRPIMTSANFLREQLLPKSPNEQNQDDKDEAVVFARAAAGEPINWSEMAAATAYLTALCRKYAPGTPINPGAIVR